MPHRTVPAEAWRALREGNERFVAGAMEHPSQDADRRADVRDGQQPFAVLLGCSDSRVAAEIIFDRGLGDLFVVRTAGHVIDATVLGSVEYAVAVLGTPLVLVLGHDSCGAIAATLDSLRTGTTPPGHIRSIVDRVRPSVVDHADAPAETVLAEHVRYTVRTLLEDSVVVRTAVAEGRCAVVGTTYELADGRVRAVATQGPVDVDDVGARPDAPTEATVAASDLAPGGPADVLSDGLPAAPPGDRPVDQPDDQPAHQPAYQPVDLTVDQPTYQPAYQPVDLPDDRPDGSAA